ncbi:MAG: outer membrane beta-barrel protein [Bacteroidales bacterium]|nr:outer membrane beta-barrel protein [Bacteroidales bacterium]
MNEEKFNREDERLDDLFRSSVGEMRSEPSAGVWKKLNRQMLRSELLKFQFTNLPKAFWGIIPAAVIITGIALYLGSGENVETTNYPVMEEVTAEVTKEATSPSLPAEAPQADAQLEVATTTTSSTTTSPHHYITTSPPNNGTTSPQPILASQMESRESITVLSCLYPEPILSGITNPPTIQAVTNPIPQETPWEILRKPVSRSLDMGINITPDMVFYSNPSSSFKYNYTFDFGARYNLGRFYIQSGAGLTYSTDIGDYAISCLKNDSVGFYYYVNSFYVEPANPENPQFETKQVTVYDSVLYLYDYSTKNKYYYLQIPLTVGYRIINKPAWRLSVEAGLLYAYLISINEPAPTFYIPEGRILDIERRTPERNKHSLGLTGGVSVEYQFARNFFLLIEPTFKYYMQSIEENSSRGDKQPYSIGLRAGIWYRLNFKNSIR